ncbi:1-acyl-sn-glycerol-3-phosphate acyltransferase [Acidithiobacillus sp. HP-6]|uniref:lysophospholipid acyltransferase family protein n=1 Tax=unclassified Acidithiobacillus TaxID=2614800 RepID=UPI00187AF48B|nr:MULTISPECIES: lysophospholipid acyltransferase family protein [unclassified Acidithiobacillus]MBE7563405.1 1-acyl-sn-glycerol-3-phosphate acyltransferase [Acidithiobacillus sp. HP-6]MBE7569618.1 1-acyl-sn-glycerol-3-phosphate acyltransferase [Acidithiobacillus sp. HP-2]MDD2748615.1 lysophospholipid acyltransferase family protein [Acidithiobacillus sp.]MDD5278848.1 lysophospholipid acyltransferase family protein [Acidithiobacillus sp.]
MIQTLRSGIFYIGFTLWTIIWAFFTLLTVPMPLSARVWSSRLWARTAVLWLRLSCGLSYQVTGLENIPDTPCVIVANHQSALETLLLWCLFPRLSYVLKQELFRIPVIGWGLRLAWPIGIDRSAGRQALVQVMEEGKLRLAAGFNVVIFPEGTRYPCGEVGPFSSTAAGLALRAEVPLLPIAVNSGCFWARNDWRKKPGKMDLWIGPAFAPKGKSSTLTEQAESWIRNTVMQMPGEAAKP